ncbi:MAG: glycoside hydrolase family 76 protein [Alicyclobacillus sp.]|nr:glycoside hydrolase family 76 protein [Alicyclobacillus sp.]
MIEVDRAMQTYDALRSCFHLADSGLYLEHYVPKTGDPRVSYLWPYSGVLSALNALAQIPSITDKYKGELTRAVDRLSHYYDSDADPPGYKSYLHAEGGGPKFYDDNEWLGLEFVRAYRTFGEEEYLRAAVQMFEFAISGWTEHLGGGIYWNQSEPNTKNTCSNGPAAVLALQLYQETGHQKYLDWALRILHWLNRLRDPETGVYWDHIRLDGTIDKRTYTYNVGTVLHANALLFAITQDVAYLQEARTLARDAHCFFARHVEGIDIPMYPDTPWFNAVLLRGYIALYEVDPLRCKEYLDVMSANVDFAWQHSRDRNGLFSSDWTARRGVSEPHKWLLDQAAMVEIYALLAAMNREDRNSSR